MSREVVYPGPKIEYSVQVQLRFCLNETTCEQDDNFPPSICVKINSKMCPLPVSPFLSYKYILKGIHHILHLTEPFAH